MDCRLIANQYLAGCCSLPHGKFGRALGAQRANFITAAHVPFAGHHLLDLLQLKKVDIVRRGHDLIERDRLPMRGTGKQHGKCQRAAAQRIDIGILLHIRIKNSNNIISQRLRK